MKYDLNAARVDALKIALDNGMSTETFNAMWRTVIRGVKGSAPTATRGLIENVLRMSAEELTLLNRALGS